MFSEEECLSIYIACIRSRMNLNDGDKVLDVSYFVTSTMNKSLSFSSHFIHNKFKVKNIHTRMKDLQIKENFLLDK